MSSSGRGYCPVCGRQVSAWTGKCMSASEPDHTSVRLGITRPSYCEVCGQRVEWSTGKCQNAGDLQHSASGSGARKPAPRTCPSCLGSGVIHNGLMRCGACGGTGRTGG